MSAARFEVVHSGPYRFHARFVAANGETVWVTESYKRRRAAEDAIWLLVDSRTFGQITAVDEREP